MEIGLLGPLTVTRDGRQVELGGAQPRLLLALLALDPGRVVSTDRLVDALWGERLPAAPANALQVVVSRLRRALAPDRVIVSRPAGYLLALDPDRVDAVRFERLAAAARAAAGEGGDEHAADLLRAALRLWRGDALVDFPAVPAARAAATRLEEARLAAVEARIEADLGLGRQALVVGELQALVQREPLRERLHSQLMRALYATGRQADALAAFQRARSVLAEQAGLDPGPELRGLERRLLAQDPALAIDAPSRAATGAAPPRSNLPVSLTSFVGRDAELAKVAELLDAGRLVTLVGPGGVGKTRLAVEAAARCLAGGGADDGAVLVELAALDDPARLPGVVLDAVAPQGDLARRDAGPADDSGKLLNALGRRRPLLVLDNCEHLVEAVAGLVGRILAACPGVRVLATSREALRVPGELRLPVPALALPPEALLEDPAGDLDAPAALVATAAGRLFVERARAVVPSFDPDAADARSIAEICRRLDGLPLAIELAAARVNVLPVAELAGRLHDRFRLLTAGARTALPRHRTLRAVVDWSWELLAPAERVALRRLAVFAGGCTLPAAERVCAGGDLAAADVAIAIAGLVEKSLVEVVPGPSLPAPSWPGIEDADLPPVPPPPPGQPRYRLLETVRAYAAERLDEAGEAAALAAERAAWCLDIVASQAERYGAEQVAWLTQMHAEQDNLRGGLRFLLDRGEADGAVRLAGLLAWNLMLTSHRDEAAAALRAALDLPGGTDGASRAEALVSLAWIRLRADGRAVFAARVDEAVAAFRAAGAPAHAELTGALAGSVDEVGVGGRPRSALPPPPVSPEALDRVLDAALAERGWTFIVAWCGMLRAASVALAHLRHGDAPTARRIAESYLARLDRVGDRISTIDALELNAGIAVSVGEVERADSCLRQALAIACEVRSAGEIAVQLALLGSTALQLGDLGRARASFAQALAAFDRFGVPDLRASTGVGLGLVATAGGDHDAALARYEDAAATYARVGDASSAAAARALVGLAAAAAGDHGRARAEQAAALAEATDGGDDVAVTVVLLAMAGAAALAGASERAGLLLGAARGDSVLAPFAGRPDMLTLLSSRVLEASTDAARADLGDEAFAAAVARGRALGPAGVPPDGDVPARPDGALPAHPTLR